MPSAQGEHRLSVPRPTVATVASVRIKAARTPLPLAFTVWVCGALASQLGDAALSFAVGWSASAQGGAAAGLVLSAINLPRTLLLLVGGVAGDRWGARRVMIIGDALMLVFSAVLGGIAWRWGTPLPLLLVAGVIIGCVDAFYLPSAGSMPRRLVADAQLARALAVRQSGGQLVTMLGGPVGGFLVAAAGFVAAAWTDSVTFALVLVVLVSITVRTDVPLARGLRTQGATDPREGGVLREIADGLRVAARTPVLWWALRLVGVAAGFIIPVTSLLVPLLARANGWAAGAAGLIVGAQGVGTIAVTVIVARRGTGMRPTRTALAGLLGTAAGLVVLAFATSAAVAGVGAVVVGVGGGLFVSHLSPMLLGAAPRSHLSRVQALLTLMQSLVLLVTNVLLGTIARAFEARTAILLCAGVLVVCVLTSSLRRGPLPAA